MVHLRHVMNEQEERLETRKYSASLKLYRWIAKSTTAKMVALLEVPLRGLLSLVSHFRDWSYLKQLCDQAAFQSLYK